MSEIRTSLDFRQFICVPFPDSLDFGQCLKSEQKRLDFGHFFLSEIQTLKSKWEKSLDFRQKKGSEIQTFVFGFWLLFYLHTSDNFLSSTYSLRLNVRVSKQKQKSLLHAI